MRTLPMTLSTRFVYTLFAALVCNLSNLNCVAAERPNIVWLISEDNSVHYLDLYDPGGAPTPNTAKLAESGLLFRHAFSNSPVCSVARTTLMTGCYGPRIGTQFHRRSVTVPMPTGVKMFPAYLRTAGYYTTNNSKKDYNAEETEGTWDESSKTASWRDRQPGQPFFHMQSFGTTHESSLHFKQTVFETQKTDTDPASVKLAPYHPDTELFRYTLARYHDKITEVDGQIGAVVDQLRADDLLDDTFVFYFGDHGGVLPRGKGYAYESGLHVPLVVHVPKNFRNRSPWQPGSSVEGAVQFVDFGATALKLAGLSLPEKIDGTPFMGAGITAEEIDQQDEAFGYADRFDEKYDLVRTLRKGKYEYVRSYQPFNIDGLQNNYRYIMLAYRQWRELHRKGELNAVQSQFFEMRPAELLFDIEKDPHETVNLATDPAYTDVLVDMRQRLRQRVKSMPDLSFYPESFLVDNVFTDPTDFGSAHRDEISTLIDTADLSLLPWNEAEPELRAALDSRDRLQQYWGLIVCSCFGQEAIGLASKARLLSKDDDILIRTRAAEFLAIIGAEPPQDVLMDCLAESRSGVRTNLILNTVVLLQDVYGYQFDISIESLHHSFADQGQRNNPGAGDVMRRLAYLTAPDGNPQNPKGSAPKVKKKRSIQ